MKLSIYFLFPFFFIHSAWSLDRCGQDWQERLLGSEWIELGRSEMRSSFKDVEGVICAMIDLTERNLSYLSYRDNTGVIVIHPLSAYMASDIRVVSKYDLPKIARPLVRQTDILTMGVTNYRIFQNKQSFSINLKFLKNIRKGSYLDDIRNLVLDITFDKIFLEKTAKYKNTNVEQVRLSITGFGLNIYDIELMENNKIMTIVNTASLPVGIRR
jgi:hypothetical protein